MKRTLLLLALGAPLWAAPAGWKYEQEVTASSEGLQKLVLPPEVLEAARDGFEDLRLWDAEGREVPCRVLVPSPDPAREVSLEGFSSRLEKGRTEASGSLPSAEVVDLVRLDAAEGDFLKAATVEVSEDGAAWRAVARGRPLFRRPGRGEFLYVEFPKARALRVRVSLDDALSPAVAVRGLRARVAGAEDVFETEVPLAVKERLEEGGVTRLDFLLPSRSLQVREVRLKVRDPFFSRRATPQLFGRMGEDEPRSFPPGALFRLEGRGGKKDENLAVPLRTALPDRRLRLLIDNQDAPPLDIAGVVLVYRPPTLLFHAARPGRYVLGAGHASVPAPRYEAAGLPSSNDALAGAAPVRPGAFRPNPSYDVREAFALWPDAGGPLTEADWRRRARVRVAEAGFQVLAVPAEVWREGGALSLGKGGKQVPFVLEPAGEEVLPVEASPASSGRPGESRWEVRPPFARMAARRLEVRVAEKLFRRSVRVEEDDPSAGGRFHGGSVWTATPGAAGLTAVSLGGRFASDRFFLTVEDGDNAPLTLSDFRLVLDKAVLVFKASPEEDLWLYWGRDGATGVPDYDLSLMREELRKMEKKNAALEPPQAVRGGWGGIALAAPAQRAAFGAALALAAILVLWLVARLFPRAPDGK